MTDADLALTSRYGLTGLFRRCQIGAAVRLNTQLDSCNKDISSLIVRGDAHSRGLKPTELPLRGTVDSRKFHQREAGVAVAS